MKIIKQLFGIKLKTPEEKQKNVNGNGRHHHFELGNTISDLKQQLENMNTDLITLKMLLGQKFYKARTTVKKAGRLIIRSARDFQRSKKLLENIEKL